MKAFTSKPRLLRLTRHGRTFTTVCQSFFLLDIVPNIILYNLHLVGVSRITKEEAYQLVNQTYRLPGDEDHFVIQLDVFHQLHCLVCAMAIHMS